MQRGIDRARTYDRFVKRGGFGPEKGFIALDREWGLIDRLAAYIPGQLAKPTQLNLLLRDLCDPDSYELALVAVASLLHSALYGREDPEMTIDLGKAVQDLAFEKKVLRPEKYSRKVGRAAMEAGYRSKEWSVVDDVQVGNALLDFCLSALPDAFRLVTGTKGVKAVIIPEEKEDEAVEILAQLILAHPVHIPTTSPPKPWTGWRSRGGERASSTFVTGVYHEETKKAFVTAFRDGSMKPHLDGMHALESVPYRINTVALDALKHYPEILEQRFQKKLRKLEAKREQMIAANVSGKAMHWINYKIKAHAKQFKQDKRQLKVDLAEAARLKGTPFYIPLRCDFRGRVYPLPHFNYQREDPIRSLFLFERGEPITEQGIRRLQDYTAARWGHGWDKETLDKRRDRCEENWKTLIEPTAKQTSKEWFQADDPYLFLAACTELVAARNNPRLITRLPIAFDGLTNGLVHYCCLTRQDTIGLLAAGSTATPAVDAYMVVAKRVNPDNPDRELAKKPVQQYFYGATGTRRADQIRDVLEERDDVTLPSDPSEAAKLYYAIGEDHKRAIEIEFPGAKETMEFLQSIARELAKRGKWLQWPNPTGFPLINRYEEPEYKTIESKLRGVRVRRKIAVGYKPTVLVGKSKNAAAANVTHSLDAAHLMLTASACRAAGIDMMGIHDGFIVLPPQAERLNEMIRLELVRMYGANYLTEIRDAALRIAVEKKQPSQMAALAKHPLAKRVAVAAGTQAPKFKEVPKRGSFDLREIIDNVYIFSS